MRLTLVFLLLVWMIAGVSSVLADDLPEYWQSQRDRINSLGNEACEGSKTAFRQVFTLAKKKKNPVAQHELAWILAKSHCRVFGHPRIGIRQLLEDAAELGYPVSQFYHGLYMLERPRAQDKSKQEALCWIYRSIEGGYGVGAEYLSKNYLLGSHVGFDPKLSRGFYMIAKEEQVQRKDMEFLNSVYEKVEVSREQNKRFMSQRLAECDTISS